MFEFLSLLHFTIGIQALSKLSYIDFTVEAIALLKKRGGDLVHNSHHYFRL